jgi:hypothetical protein
VVALPAAQQAQGEPPARAAQSRGIAALLSWEILRSLQEYPCSSWGQKLKISESGKKQMLTTISL